MSELTSNIEVAHKLHEHGLHHAQPASRRDRWVEILEAAVLAIVAVLTAWGGHQASKWEALSAKEYALATRTSVRAQEGLTLAGQDRLYDIVTFNGWLAAKSAGNVKLIELFERRFRPEYLVAFTAWQKLDPFNNPSAPAGRSSCLSISTPMRFSPQKLSEQATVYFDQGVQTRENADSYIKVTVFLPT